MDMRYIRIVICFIALPNTRPVLSVFHTYKLELTQNVSASSTLAHSNEDVTKTQTPYSSSHIAKVLQNTSILLNSSESQDLLKISQPKQGLSQFFQFLRNNSLETSDIILNMTKLLLKSNSNSISDLLFNTSEVISKDIPEPVQPSNKSEKLEKNSSSIFLDPLFNTSEVILKTIPALLDLLSNNTHGQPEVNITPSSFRKFFVMDANGTIERRQARPVYFDILYSKPPNRFYAKQVATYGDGSTEPTTTPVIITFNNTCDYDAYYCLKIYTTGYVCARTIYYEYHTFPNYCLMEYSNCFFRLMEWTLAYMGRCIDLPMRYGFYEYPYDDNSYLKSIRIIEDANSMPIDLY